MTRPIKNLLGQKFGKLTVIELVNGRRNNCAVWKCLCDCGNEHLIASSHLSHKRRGTKSCGCSRMLPHGEASFNVLYGNYKRHAEEADRLFEINRKNFREIVTQNCYYCGAKPNQKYNYENANGWFIYNGIDRVDNSKGYMLENCVPCCKMCNIAKGTNNQKDFLGLIKRIYEYRFIRGDELR